MTHEELALTRLTSEFQSSEKVKGLLSAIVKPLDALKADYDAIKTERWIDTAIGQQLDGCGAIVLEPRSGRSDEEYRAAIKFRVFVNRSSGTPQDLIKALKYFIASDDVQYLESYPATAILFADGPSVPANIQAQIQELSPAGISDVPVCVSYTAKPLRFSKATNDPTFKVNGNFLILNGKKFRVSANQAQDTEGPRLGGLALPCLKTNTKRLKINGKKFRLASPDSCVPIESGFHLTGVY